MEPIIVVSPNWTRFRHKIFELGQELPIPFMKPGQLTATHQLYNESLQLYR